MRKEAVTANGSGFAAGKRLTMEASSISPPREELFAERCYEYVDATHDI